MKLDPASGVPFYRQVEASLADDIRTGVLAPGAMLPSVRALAEQLLVSVITVKQAYAALESAGLVRSHQGRGTWVTETGAEAARAQVRATVVAHLRDALTVGRARGLTEPELRELVLSLLETP